MTEEVTTPATTPNTPKPETKPNGGEASAGESQSSGEKSKTKVEFTAEQQAAVDAIVEARLKREREQAEKAAKKAAETAETAKLAEQQQWKELSEKQIKQLVDLEAKVAEIDALKGSNEAYEKTLNVYLAEARKSVPAHLITLLDKLTITEQLEYITANAASFKVSPTPLPGTPKAAADKTVDQAAKDKMTQDAGKYYRRTF